nr:hypothetical protein CFP56_27525 [Quercus suber]
MKGLWVYVFSVADWAMRKPDAPTPCEGKATSRPYGKWLKAGAKTKQEGPRSKVDSLPQHDPASQPPALNRVT